MALLPSAYAPAIGGVEELTARLATQLIARGDQVEVWTNRHPSNLAAAELIDGIQVRRMEFPLPGLALSALVRAPFAARAALNELTSAAAAFRPDILHVQCFSGNGAYASMLARRLGLPLVVTLQGETVMDDTDIYKTSITLRRALRTALRRADAVTACSQFVLEDAEARFGLAPSRGRVIPNGVDLEGRDAPTRVDLPFERFVLALGRVVPKKGFDLLLEAFARITPRHPGLGLVIGGDGAARAELERQAAALGVADRVSFPGALGRGEVGWAMRHAAAFVLPSRVEPFGIVVLEALRAGCPVVVSSHGGAPEIVRDEIDGLVVDPTQPEALAAAIERVLDDASLARRLRAAGPPRVAAYDWRAVAAEYRILYEEALAAAEAPRGPAQTRRLAR